MSTENAKKSIKPVVVVTYIIALVMLIAVWFIPAFGLGQSGVDGIINMMMFWYIPAFINAFLSPFTGSNLLPVGNYDLPDFAHFESKIIPGVEIDLPAMMVIAMLVITVFAIIFLIPVIRGKRTKKTSVKSAYVIEGAAIFAMGILLMMASWEQNLKTALMGYGSITCVFVGLLVILCIQVIAEKKSYGAAKVFLFIFTTATFLFAMFALDNIVMVLLGESMRSGWNDFLTSVGLSSGLMNGDGGLTIMKALVGGMLGGKNVIWVADASVTSNIINVCVLALFAITAFNVLVDLIGLLSGNKNNNDGVLLHHKGGKIFGLVRYGIALLVIVVIVVCGFVDADCSVGICGLVALLFALINVIINVARLMRVPSQKRKAAAQNRAHIELYDEGISEDDEDQTDLIGDEMPVAPYPVYADGELISPIAEPVEEAQTTTGEQLEISALPVYDSAESVTESEEPEIYTPRPVIYNGPTDDFLDTLSTEEKIEFCKVFVDKSKGELPLNMPEYEIGGQNDDFFPAVFINLGRFRAMLTNGLLRKIYKYLNTK